MKVKALFTLLSQKLKDGELLFVDSIKFSEPKAKEAKSILSNLSKISGFEKILSKKNNSVLIILGKNNINTTKSFNNFNNTEIINVKSLSSVDLLKYKHIVITEPEESVAFIEGKKL